MQNQQECRIPLLVVAGPTASGKTGLGVELCLRHSGEVVSADSMQIYRGMDIGTAKATPEERRGVPHHLMDFLPPEQSFSVADYVRMASEAIADIRSRGKLPVLVGGTGLYISSLVDNLDFSPSPQSPQLRQQLREKALRCGNAALLEELRGFDPETAEKLHENNLGRVIRAIEVYRLTGVTMAETVRRSRQKASPYQLCMLGLTTTDRQLLYSRIDRRVDQMMAGGLPQEAKALLGRPLSPTARQAIGYKELEPWLQGTATLEQCAGTIKQETRRYAKRQLTWFRRDGRFHWLEVDRYDSVEALAAAAEPWIAAELAAEQKV